jgi:hypothetical protein
MAKRKSKSKSKSKSRKKASTRERIPLGERLAEVDWLRVRRVSHALVWVLGVAALVAAAVFGGPRLEAVAAARTTVNPTTIEIRFLNPPAWMNGDLEAMLDHTARQHLTGDPFARLDLVAARQSLIDTGWFEEVRQVRRRRADLVEVEASFVRPFAIVRDADGDHLVDPTGRLLPRSYPAGGKPSFIAISGVRFDRPSRAGLQWEGADVTAALRLLRLIHDRPWLGQVASIDTARFLGDQTLILVTDRGCRIIWGREPGAESVSEVPAARKLQYLDYHYQEHRHIDRGFAHELDITGDIVLGR